MSAHRAAGTSQTELRARFLVSRFVALFSGPSRRFPLSNDVSQIAKCGSLSIPTDGCLNRKRSEEHTSELQSRFDLVCRLLLEKKKKKKTTKTYTTRNNY